MNTTYRLILLFFVFITFLLSGMWIKWYTRRQIRAREDEVLAGEE